MKVEKLETGIGWCFVASQGQGGIGWMDGVSHAMVWFYPWGLLEEALASSRDYKRLMIIN